MQRSATIQNFDEGCTHMRKFKAEGGNKTLQLIHKYAEISSDGRLPAPRCSTCGTYTGRIFACLHCVYFACVGHLKSHLKSSSHNLALELSVMHVFCNECNNYVYNTEWESFIRLSKRKKSRKSNSSQQQQTESNPNQNSLSSTTTAASNSNNSNTKSGSDDSGDDEDDDDDEEEGMSTIKCPSSDDLRRIDSQSSLLLLNSPTLQSSSVSQLLSPNSNSISSPWLLSSALNAVTTASTTSFHSTLSSEELLRNFATAVAPHTIKTPVRGLRNLGASCFMNAVLQCLIHNPLLRNWFLSDMHWKCQIKASNTNNQTQQQQQQQQKLPCVACEFGNIVAEMFDGESIPIIPNSFLFALWKIGGSLASQDQQDAHELLVTVLNAIHMELCSPTIQGNDPCFCVIHRTFGGLLRSEVTCTKCGQTSTTNDPFFDVSLDVPRQQDAQNGGGLCTLASCLEHYTRKEILAQTDRFLCSHCNERCDSYKQLSLAKLPSVICFHMKRFEHAQTRRLLSKIETRVDFPCTIDLSPFTSSSSLRALNNSNNNTTSGGRISPFYDRQSSYSAQYELFGVVNHYGKIDTGHYTSFVRNGKTWYLCDDAEITKVSLSQVLKSQAYILFYVKRRIEYEAITITTITTTPPPLSQTKNSSQQPLLISPKTEIPSIVL